MTKQSKSLLISLLGALSFFIFSVVAIYGPRELSFVAFLLLFLPVGLSTRYMWRVINPGLYVFLTFVFIGILLFTFFSRFVAKTELWGDEVAVLRMLDGSFAEVAMRVPETHYAIPLFDFWIAWIWNHFVILFPAEWMELLYRIPTMFYHVLASSFFVILVDRLYRYFYPTSSSRFIKHGIAIVAFLSYFFNPMLLFYATEVKYYSLANLGVVVTMLLFLENILFSFRVIPLVLLFGFVSSIEFIILLPLFIFHYIERRDIWRHVVLGCVFVSFYGLLIFRFSFPDPTSSKEASWLIYKTANLFMRYAFSSSLVMVFIVASSLMLVIYKKSRKYAIYLLLLVGFSTVAISTAAYVKGYFDFHPRHFIFILPIVLTLLFLQVVFIKNARSMTVVLCLIVVFYTAPGIYRSVNYLIEDQAWARARSGAYSTLRQAKLENRRIIIMPFRENKIVSLGTYQYFYLDNFYWYAHKYPTVSVFYPDNITHACKLVELNPSDLVIDWINAKSCDARRL